MSRTFERTTATPIFKPHKDRNNLPCGGIPVFETSKIKLPSVHEEGFQEKTPALTEQKKRIDQKIDVRVASL